MKKAEAEMEQRRRPRPGAVSPLACQPQHSGRSNDPQRIPALSLRLGGKARLYCYSSSFVAGSGGCLPRSPPLPPPALPSNTSASSCSDDSRPACRS